MTVDQILLVSTLGMYIEQYGEYPYWCQGAKGLLNELEVSNMMLKLQIWGNELPEKHKVQMSSQHFLVGVMEKRKSNQI